MSITTDELKRKLLVTASIISNLGVLAYFKYVNFFGENLSSLANAIGWHLNWLDLNVALPIGISFYTFEALSYTIDVYRRHIPAEKEWGRLAFLVSFFPHLIAGPIIRAADFFPQLGRRPSISRADIDHGISLIALGLVKKLLLADSMGAFADNAFASSAQLSVVEAWVGIYAFALQIYFDFSAYTEIAIGSGLLLGYKLPENFCRPYAATSISDFWRRWHISLSTWLKDYLYIPLGGNRTKTKWGTYFNLTATMLLGGLWHGAAWHFVVWGFLHGTILSAERLFGRFLGARKFKAQTPAKDLIQRFFMFHLLVLLWVPFRSPDMETLGNIIHALFDFSSLALPTRGMTIVLLLTATTFLWQYAEERWQWIDQKLHHIPLWLRSSGYAFSVFVALIMGAGETSAFIYFQF